MKLEIRLHLRVFGSWKTKVLIDNAQAVFQPAEISIAIQSETAFRASHLSDVDLGTSEIEDLRLAEQFPPNEIPVYFLQSLTPPMNGAALPDPLIIITELTTPWTLAHEIGHALSLEHRSGDEVVMGTIEQIQSPPPDVSTCEIAMMLASPLLFAVKSNP